MYWESSEKFISSESCSILLKSSGFSGRSTSFEPNLHIVSPVVPVKSQVAPSVSLFPGKVQVMWSPWGQLSARRWGESSQDFWTSATTVFGAVSGVSVAGVAAIGSMAVPQMLERGYSTKIAAGSVVTAGALERMLERRYVLRKKPPGQLLASAWHDHDLLAAAAREAKAAPPGEQVERRVHDDEPHRRVAEVRMPLERGTRKADSDRVIESDVAEERCHRCAGGREDHRGERRVREACATGEIAAAHEHEQLERAADQEQHDREMHDHGVDVYQIDHKQVASYSRAAPRT